MTWLRTSRRRESDSLPSSNETTTTTTTTTNCLWVTGAAGTGKTAILQSIAETCASEGNLAATFFFSYRWAERDNYDRFVPTIAYQLAQKIESTREFITAAVLKDISIFNQDFQSQLEALVLHPLAQAREKDSQADHPRPPWPHVIIIDALDECQFNIKQQTIILEALHKALQSHRFPFRIIIASRPEKLIRTHFSGSGSKSTRRIHLDEDYDANSDIRLYLQSSFNAIRAKYHLDESWPSDADVQLLVRRASGQFIYASTALKYIDDPSQQPEEHLHHVLNIEADHQAPETHPLAPLDILYTSILNRCPDPTQSALTVQMISVLHSRLSAGSINHLLGYRPQDHARIFDGLHSLLHVPAHDNPDAFYNLHHKTLVDFLESTPTRAQHLFNSKKLVYSKIGAQYLKLCTRTATGEQ
ncbi:hypothetical protein FA15DRAFT_591221 [Coprinopsis marcescibilis]|uniref:Nephrocystin 3-like N-terminal domain-containing protein n=1 Tax=Coprinopsis marcescibilis TaxID=230819 RepID=A0A5C3LA47_COPMA|nr:hypothetical protein FA15DRAFT_591221 [Coprinopsis marcescibilis]